MRRRLARTRTGRKRTEVDADFGGSDCPTGSTVEFDARGLRLRGTVGELGPRHAIVGGVGERRWRVPYSMLRVIERAGNGCTLAEIKKLADGLLAGQRGMGQLDEQWRIALDTSPRRAGSCSYGDKTIYLSVGHCLVAPKAEVIDTVLHEIAHAIAGAEHGHDDHWRRIAVSIGCSGERCTTETHTATRWIGRCGCEKTYHRQVLTRRVRTGRCRTCGGQIAWSINSDARAPR